MRLGYEQLEQLPRPDAPRPASLGELDEVLVADARAGLTPADMVERKLLQMLGGVFVAGSRVRWTARSPGLHEHSGISAR